jgi:hypothetical protein
VSLLCLAALVDIVQKDAIRIEVGLLVHNVHNVSFSQVLSGT